MYQSVYLFFARLRSYGMRSYCMHKVLGLKRPGIGWRLDINIHQRYAYAPGPSKHLELLVPPVHTSVWLRALSPASPHVRPLVLRPSARPFCWPSAHLLVNAYASIFRCGHLFRNAYASIYRCGHLFINAYASIYRCGHLCINAWPHPKKDGRIDI